MRYSTLPKTSQGLAALGSLDQLDMAIELRRWDRAKHPRLRHRTFKLAYSRLEVIEQALATALAEFQDLDPNNPNPRGNALYRVWQAYLIAGM